MSSAKTLGGAMYMYYKEELANFQGGKSILGGRGGG